MHVQAFRGAFKHIGVSPRFDLLFFSMLLIDIHQNTRPCLMNMLRAKPVQDRYAALWYEVL